MTNPYEQFLDKKSEEVEDSSYDDIIAEASETYGVDPSLIRAMIEVESDGKSSAKSNKGATGLMQVMPGTLKAMGFTDATDPYQNIMAGTKYIGKQLKDSEGNVPLALAKYNAGPGAVNEYGGVPPFKETEGYIEKVQGLMAKPVEQPMPVEQGLQGQEANPYAQFVDSAAPQTAPVEEDKGFFKSVGEDISARYGKVTDYAKRQDSIMAKAPAIGAVAASQGVAALGDVVGEGVMRTVSAVTPDAAKEALKNKLAKLAQTEEGQWALENISAAGSKITEIAEKYPDAALALEGVATLLGASTAQKGAGLLSKATESARKKVADVTKDAVKKVSDVVPDPSARVVTEYAKNLAKNANEGIIETVNKVFKPKIAKGRTPAQINTFDKNKITAITSIVENKKNLKLLDADGDVTYRLPENSVETQTALDQTKKSAYVEMERAITLADGQPLTVTGDNIVKNLTDSIINDKSLQIEGKDVIKYAQERIEEYSNWTGGAADTQKVIQRLNSKLDNYYKNPTKSPKDYAKIYVDVLVRNNLRKDLDKVIETAKGASSEDYLKYKKIYSSLKSIEDDVARAANSERNSAVTKLLPTFTDVIAGHQLITGIAAGSSPTFWGGLGLFAVSSFRKVYGDPKRKIKKMFKDVDRSVDAQKKIKVDKPTVKVEEPATKVAEKVAEDSVKIPDRASTGIKGSDVVPKSSIPKPFKPIVRPAHEQIPVKKAETGAERSAAALKKAREDKLKREKGKKGSPIYVPKRDYVK